MVFLNRLIISLFLLLPLTLDVYGALTELSMPERQRIHICSKSSYADVMKAELRKWEKDATLTSFDITKGGLSADLVLLSPHYAARKSASPLHVVEADQFCNIVRSAQSDHITLKNIGFTVCFPFAIQLVVDEADRSASKTIASIIYMPRAHGSPLFKHLTSKISDDSKALMLLDLGTSLASFQMTFMRKVEGEHRTASHGDFHGGNIFGLLETSPDKLSTKWSFSLVDCAGLSFKGMHPLMDPLYFIYRAGYVVYSSSGDTSALYNLTRNFYRGYLGGLSIDVNRNLYSSLPNWRNIASSEMVKTQGLLFFSTKLPGAASFLSLFDSLNTRAAKNIFKELGYELWCGTIPVTGQPLPALTTTRIDTIQSPSTPAPAIPEALSQNPVLRLLGAAKPAPSVWVPEAPAHLLAPPTKKVVRSPTDGAPIQVREKTRRHNSVGATMETRFL